MSGEADRHRAACGKAERKASTLQLSKRFGAQATKIKVKPLLTNRAAFILRTCSFKLTSQGVGSRWFK